MRKNRKVSKRMSVVAQNTAYASAVLMAAFVVVIVNLLASSSCSQLMKSIGEKERTLSRLEDERSRESARWEEMKTPERLEQALMRHGLSMKPPKPDQIIRMDREGRLIPNQFSVAKEAQRQRNLALAMSGARTMSKPRR